jgi:Protein of unknown function (DUF2917)
MERHSSHHSDDLRIVIDRARLTGLASMTVQDGDGAVLIVEDGSVWLTQENDGRDIVVPTGERFRLDRDGHALIEGLPNAVVTLVISMEQPVPDVTLRGNYSMASGMLRRHAPTVGVERLLVDQATCAV